MRKIEDDAVLVFAGPADIDEDNLARLLNQHLPPENMGPAVVQRSIPSGTHQGLRKTLAWLTGEVTDEGIDRPRDLRAYIDALDSEALRLTYLVLLWGDGGDEETERLADYASRLGISILGLDHGMDELELGEHQDTRQEQEPPAAGRRRRRRSEPDEEAGETAGQGGKAAGDKPPWEPDAPGLQLPADEYAVVKGFALVLEAVITYIHAHLSSMVIQAGMPAAARPEAAPPPKARSRRQPPAEDAPVTRTWLKNPDLDEGDPEAYVLGQRRGRQPRNRADWPKVELTAAEEISLGLDDTRK